MSMFKNVNVVYYYVKDWEGTKKFYGEILGWPLMYGDDSVGWMEYGVDNATHVAINKSQSSDQGSAGVGATVVFTVDSAEKTQEWLKSRGVRCDEILVIPGVVKVGTFYDPEGNRMQFAESNPPPA